MHTDSDDIELRLLIEAIYHKYHYDFRNYAMASVKRRLIKACENFSCRSYSMLQDLVMHDEDVFPELLSYLTVQVSEMFRDPSYFLSLRKNVVPHLKTYPSLKVWVAGCSAGEELYSLAILFREEGLEERTMFYATDINQDALKKAQAGVYKLDRMPLFSQNYQKSGGKHSLSEYYTAAYGNAKFDKSLTKRTVFSDHSLVTDSVFGEMNLISCRNVLIYFNRDLQDRAFSLFKDSLAPRGFLGLGSKETLRFSESHKAFDEFDRKERIYQKKTRYAG
ncbi:MAG: chemotaxis protein CheR [Alphaproteobacteria bacterium]|nr:chemotaxis protein CheR [Alphaproteobacteria bacterium]